jgi:hypothetical protein
MFCGSKPSRNSVLAFISAQRMLKSDVHNNERRTDTPPTTVESNWEQIPMHLKGQSALLRSGKCLTCLGLNYVGQTHPSSLALSLP